MEHLLCLWPRPGPGDGALNKTDTALASCELEVKAVFLKPESGDPLGVFVNMKIPGPCPRRKLEAGTCVVLTKSPNFSEPRFPHL